MVETQPLSIPDPFSFEEQKRLIVGETFYHPRQQSLSGGTGEQLDYEELGEIENQQIVDTQGSADPLKFTFEANGPILLDGRDSNVSLNPNNSEFFNMHNDSIYA